MKSPKKFLLLGILIGGWLAALFVKMDFDGTIAGLTEAGNATWDNLRVEMIDTITLLILGLSILTVVTLIIAGLCHLTSRLKKV